MELNKYFSLDPDKAEKGNPVRLYEDGVIYVGRYGSSKHRECVTKHLQRLMNDPEASRVPQEERARMAELEALCEVLVLGWENLTIDGEDLPFEPENVRALMENFDLLRERVEAAALDIQSFRDRGLSEVIEEAGNGSNGTSSQKHETSSTLEEPPSKPRRPSRPDSLTSQH